MRNLAEIEKFIDYFDWYPLISQKYADFWILKIVFNLIKNKKHLIVEGLKQIVALKAKSNLGLSEKLVSAFLDVVETPIVKDQRIKDPNLFSGFRTGEGSFMVWIPKSPTNSIGFMVTLVFHLTQHMRDEKLMTSFIKDFGCGHVNSNKTFSTIVFQSLTIFLIR